MSADRYRYTEVQVLLTAVSDNVLSKVLEKTLTSTMLVHGEVENWH